MASLKFKNVYINTQESIVGPYEKKGLIKFKNSFKDLYANEETFENMEIKMQRTVLDNLLYKNHLKCNDISAVIGGDLMNQITATCFNMRDFDIPFLGVYSACASFVESLILASNLLENRTMKNIVTITSSHNLTSEKQFRFPVEYGALKPKRATFTATGSVAALLSKTPSKIKIESATIGKVVDLGISDPFNMGAVMTPAAASSIASHLKDLKRDINYYDLVLTGDLGKVGTNILKDYLKDNYNIILNNHLDAGTQIYKEDQPTYAGASGPVALPLVLFNKILTNKKYKKILIVGTGSLHSPIMCNQKNTIPAIAHVVSLEVLN